MRTKSFVRKQLNLFGTDCYPKFRCGELHSRRAFDNQVHAEFVIGNSRILI
jgi:hypothetical protein